MQAVNGCPFYAVCKPTDDEEVSKMATCGEDCSFDYEELQANKNITLHIYNKSDVICTAQNVTGIRESVDSLCRDGAMPPYIGKAFTRTNFEDLGI